MEPLQPPTERTLDTGPIACLGEAILDLICEQNLAEGESPGSYVPWAGGALANVAVGVARCGVPSALAGGVGADRWGEHLKHALAHEGVSIDWLATIEGADTPVALVQFDADNEPSFNVYGEHIGPTMAAVSDRLGELVDFAQALVIGSNTMVEETEREVTRRAVDLARDQGIPILLDPNYRPNRWMAPEIARDFCLELVGLSTVVKLNLGEATLLTGETDGRTAARALVEMGPGLVVVTDGEGEIVTAGEVEADFQPDPVEAISPLGAGDAFMGGLAAGLAELDWDLSRVAQVLPRASSLAAAVCGVWGAWQ